MWSVSGDGARGLPQASSGEFLNQALHRWKGQSLRDDHTRPVVDEAHRNTDRVICVFLNIRPSIQEDRELHPIFNDEGFQWGAALLHLRLERYLSIG